MKLKPHIDPIDFKSRIEGKKINLYCLKNNNGIEVTFTNYGQRLVSLIVPDKNENFEDIVLGYSSLAEYVKYDKSYFGAVIGRYGNRIAKGKFYIDNQEYSLQTNSENNHLHGGTNGFHNVVWGANQVSDHEIEFSRLSPDLEEGYPGNLEVRVNYKLTNTNELRISYHALTDKTTIVNLTHHSFFNLKGEGNGTINDHLLTINADKYAPISKSLIPTGKIENVKGTPFDFRSRKLIGQHLGIKDQQLLYGNGYDHSFSLNNAPKDREGLVLAARVEEPDSGRILEVLTTEPAVHFYGGNFLNGQTARKKGQNHSFRGAFCLETQHFPDSPNQANFPSTVLNPGEDFSSTTVYRFSVDKYP